VEVVVEVEEAGEEQQQGDQEAVAAMARARG